MSEEPEKPDLCHSDNTELLQQSIDLYQCMFRVDDDPELYYYFSTLSVLRLLINFGAIGIKVQPALVHVPEKSIDLTVVLKTVMHPINGDNSKTLRDILGDDEIKKILALINLESEILGNGSTACCPTPGRPLNSRAVKIKLTNWINNLTDFRDGLPDE